KILEVLRTPNGGERGAIGRRAPQGGRRMHRIISILSGMVLLPALFVGSGDVELVAEVLNPEDRAWGKAVLRQRVMRGPAEWNAVIALVEKVPLEEMVWERVRFTLRYADETKPAIEEIRPVAEILRRPVMRILGQR